MNRSNKLNDKRKELLDKLKSEGKFEILNKPEHLEAINKMNKRMEEVRQEYIKMSQESEKLARDFWIS